ncbi:MAG: flagellar biosynthetic protein FliO [Plesiomonas sp.]|uniref:flagellar biosynthetic protein FliO n=1 Tax=Plesiomonas sp. TaxID=2486279 RepID=UPI003F3629EB
MTTFSYRKLLQHTLSQQIGCVAVLFASPLFATPITGNTTILAASGQSPTSIGMALLSLLCVLALIVGLGWLAKRLRLPLHNKSSIQIEQQQALGQRERLLIVNVEGQRLLVGVTPQHISLLTTLNSAQENQNAHSSGEITHSTAATTAHTLGSGFAQQLRAAMQRRAGSTEQSVTNDTTADQATTSFSCKSAK